MKKPTREIKQILDSANQLPIFPSGEEDEKAMLDQFIRSRLNESVPLTLSKAVDHFLKPPHGLDKWQTAIIIARLIAGGTVILKFHGRMLNFRESKNILLKPSEWDNVYIEHLKAPADGKIEPIEEPVETVDNIEILIKTEPLIRNKIRQWRSRLLRVQNQAGQDRIRTGKKMFEFKVLLDDLMRKTDPVEFVYRFQDVRSQLTRFKEYTDDLEEFMSCHIEKWKNLVSTMAYISDNRSELEGEEQTREHLMRMDQIVESDRPFDMLNDIDDLCADVNDRHQSLINESRESATQRINQIISTVSALIDQHGGKVPDDLSHQTLRPLRELEASIDVENNILRIRKKVQDAKDHMDEMVERINNEVGQK